MNLKTLVLIASILISSISPSHALVSVEYMTEPCLIPLKGNRFKLCDNLIVRVDNKYHVVPNGFKTDLASTPRILWPFLAPNDYDSIAAAVLHDWDYCCVRGVPRQRADEIFYYSLRFHGASRLKAYLYYIGVRSVGWIYYTHGEGIKKHQDEFSEQELHGIYEDVNYELG